MSQTFLIYARCFTQKLALARSVVVFFFGSLSKIINERRVIQKAFTDSFEALNFLLFLWNPMQQLTKKFLFKFHFKPLKLFFETEDGFALQEFVCSLIEFSGRILISVKLSQNVFWWRHVLYIMRQSPALSRFGLKSVEILKQQIQFSRPCM